MGTRLYLGNVPYSVTDQMITDFFSPFKLSEIKIVRDKDTGNPRGFAFVELAEGTAQEAVDGQGLRSTGAHQRSWTLRWWAWQ
jgi:RNA recognition motif-containing protein